MGENSDAVDETVVRPRPPASAEETDATVIRATRAVRGEGSLRGSPAPPVPDPGHPAPTAAATTPRVYGARPEPAAALPERADAILQAIGLPPPAAETQPGADREGLPRLSTRFRRARIATLVAFAAAVVVSVAGLWTIVRLAF